MAKKEDFRKVAGHRKRLRDRFLKVGIDGLLDYEIVELLLTLGTPRKDCKSVAKEAIAKFKGLRGVLDASIEELQQIKGIGPLNAFGIKLFQDISERYARERATKEIKLSSPSVVADYLRAKFGREKKEHFVALLLNSRNGLINTHVVSIGTVGSSIVHPREVFGPAVAEHASRIIVAHNHPSWSLEATKEDIKITKELVAAGKILGIELVDHIIITSSGFLSFKEKELI